MGVLRFCAVDMQTTSLMLKVVKSVFPTFEFTWLGEYYILRSLAARANTVSLPIGEEMEQNLPLEMDFRGWTATRASHTAANRRSARRSRGCKRRSM